MIDYFDQSAVAHPDRLLLLSDDGDGWTYRTAQAITHRIAAGLYANGFRLDDGAAVLSANDPRAFLTILGLQRAGAVWHPLNVRNAPSSNIDFMNCVRSRWLFYHSDFVEAAQEIVANVPSIEHTVCLDRRDDRSPSLEGFMTSGDGVGVPDWGDPYGRPDKVAAIAATGGTTGKPKAVIVTNQSWATMTDIALAHWPRVEHPVNLVLAPVTHGAGAVAITLTVAGATLVMKPGFDAGDALASIERHRVTHLFLPPAAYYAMLAHPDLGRYDYSSLRMFLLAGAPVSPDKLARGVEVFGPCMAQCFGQAEAPMLVTWFSPDDVAAAARGEHPERLGSCGRATLHCQVGVMSDDGCLLPPGQRGEIVARGRLVTPGYFENPSETAAIRSEGWHHTGDIGFLDDFGYVYIVDRKKDMIITGGFNVYSADVEREILALPGVLECAVIGVPDETWGEAVKAVVVLTPDADLHEEGIIATCKEKLGSVNAPKSVEFRPSLPKTAVGKVDKKMVRSPYWERQERLVH